MTGAPGATTQAILDMHESLCRAARVVKKHLRRLSLLYPMT
jgi:hypothetical protein